VRVARDTQDLLIECCVGQFFQTLFYIWGILLSIFLKKIVNNFSSI
jgi:hypothetical protein